MVSLGEMASYLPHKKGFAGYATRFVDPALGFALGYNYLMKYVCAISLCRIEFDQHLLAGGYTKQY